MDTPSQYHLWRQDAEEESLLTIEIEDGDFAEGDVSTECAAVAVLRSATRPPRAPRQLRTFA
jgi:hypothetical protein